MRLIGLLLCLLAIASADEWYMKKWVDCYISLSIEPKAPTGDIQRAVRRVTSRTHPDRCKTPECAEEFADANNCKDTLTDAKKRERFAGCLFCLFFIIFIILFDFMLFCFVVLFCVITIFRIRYDEMLRNGGPPTAALGPPKVD
jgi:hypothetical protein